MLQSKNGFAWGTVLTILSAGLLLLLLLIRLLPDNPSSTEMNRRVNHLTFSAGAGLGQHLAKAFPQGRFLLVSQAQNVEESDAIYSMIGGLESELYDHGGSIEQLNIGFTPANVEHSASSPVDSTRDLEGAIHERLQGADFDVVVMTLLPSESLLGAWDSDRKNYPALAVICEDFRPLIPDLQNGLISAVVATRPDAVTHDPRGRLLKLHANPMKAFASRFEVLTLENIDAFVARYPHLAP